MVDFLISFPQHWGWLWWLLGFFGFLAWTVVADGR